MASYLSLLAASLMAVGILSGSMAEMAKIMSTKSRLFSSTGQEDQAEESVASSTKGLHRED